MGRSASGRLGVECIWGVGDEFGQLRRAVGAVCFVAALCERRERRSQTVATAHQMSFLTEFGILCAEFLQRCRTCGASHNRNAVAALSPALDDPVGLRWVTIWNEQQP